MQETFILCLKSVHLISLKNFQPSDDPTSKFESRFFVGLRSNAIYLMLALLHHGQVKS